MVQVYTETSGRQLFAYSEQVTNFTSSYCLNGQGVSYRDVLVLTPIEAEQACFNQTDDYPEQFLPYTINERDPIEDAVVMTEPDRSGKNVIKFIIDNYERGWIEVWYRF